MGDAARDLLLVSADELTTLITSAVQAANQGPLLLDKQSMAQRLGCSAAHIDKLRKQGLPTVAVGELVRFEPPVVLEWLRKCKSE